MIRYFVMLLIILALSGAAHAAQNENTTIVLHAHEMGLSIDCDSWLGEFSCEVGPRTLVDVDPGEYVAVFVFLRNYDAIAALSYRLAVDGGADPNPWGDWQMFWSTFACQPSQTGFINPIPTAGDLVTSFDCITGGSIAPLGYIVFVTGQTGCLSIEESSQFDSGVVDCGGSLTPVARQNRGSVCIGVGGHDACDPDPVAVEASMWGSVKQLYYRR